jgi:tetratricopeptide (TPR) repeat protein
MPRAHQHLPRPKGLDASDCQPNLPPAELQDRPDALEGASRLHDDAVSARARGEFATAAALAREALSIFEHALGPDHPDVANVLNTLAGSYEDQGEYVQAERLYQRSVEIMEPLTGSFEVAMLRVQSLGYLAGIYRIQGRYREAETLYRRALPLAEVSLGPDHLEVATCLNNLAVLYKYTAQFGQATRLYRRALAITQQAVGLDHPDVAAIYHNLGGLEHACGRYARGEPHARRAVAIRE